nr:hypothetical protein [Demequina litorisediminis]
MLVRAAEMGDHLTVGVSSDEPQLLEEGPLPGVPRGAPHGHREVARLRGPGVRRGVPRAQGPVHQGALCGHPRDGR